MSSSDVIGRSRIKALAESAAKLGSAGRSTLDYVRVRRTFAHLHSYCIFMGSGRSGSTLLGAMLNAHPEIVISNELDALYLFSLGVPRNIIFSQILKQERQFATSGYQWTGYDYAVPGQYQGRVERLLVIGDKKAGQSTRRLENNPGLLDDVRHSIRVPIRVIHIVRNPFDNITTMYRRQPHRFDGTGGLRATIDFYRQLTATVDDVRARLQPDEFFDVRYESFVDSPGPHLVRLCAFLGVGAPADYIEACAKIVRSASRTRDQVTWSEAERHEVEALIESHPHLADYGYDT